MKSLKIVFCLIFLLVSSQLTAYAQSRDNVVWVKGWEDKVVSIYRFCTESLQLEARNKEGKKLENLSFSAKNATIIKSTKEGQIDFYPLGNGSKVVLMVSDNGVFVDSLVFPIKGVPNPRIIIKYNNEVVNLKEGISLKGFTKGNLELEIVKDDFSMFMPKDTRFIFSDAEITIAREFELVSRKSINYLGKIDLFNLIAQSKSGDRLIIEVPKIIRIDSQNRSHTISHNSIYVIPIH